MNSDRLVNNSICVLSRAKIVDELLYIYKHLDIQTDSKGHRRSKYERQADFIAPRMNVYKPSPTFVFHTNDLQSGSPLEREFASLDDASLDDVMRESIYRLLDAANLLFVDIRRRDINWEIQP